MSIDAARFPETRSIKKKKKIEKKNEKKYSDTKNVLVFKDRGYEATVVRKQY